MSHNQSTQDGTQTDAPESDSDLRAELELLEEENRRLREQYVRARRASYQRTALGLGVVGAAAAVGALLVPTAQTVLFALAGIGLFAALLTYYLTPERFIAADVGERIYTALMENEAGVVRELGLTDDRLYVPHETETVRLFIPQHSAFKLPASGDLESTLVITDDKHERGVSFTPTGRTLFDEFERTISGPLGSTPNELSSQLTDALVNVFELVDTATAEVDGDGGRMTVAVTDSAYAVDDGVDHPVVSFLATGLAVGLQTPVQTEVTTTHEEDGDVDFRVTCRWDVEQTESNEDSNNE